MRYIGCTLFCVAFAALSTGVLADPAEHPASTSAELALDRVLKTADADHEILDNLFHRYPDAPVPAGKRVNYAHLLTPAFLSSLKHQERALVQHDCGGTYRDGEICGMDYNPITCAQDVLSSFTYNTLHESGSSATIAAQGQTYHMVRVNGAWKLDGVECGGK